MRHSFNILVADDHAVVRAGVRQMLAETYPNCDFAEAEDAQQALDWARRREFDLIVLDISMPGRSGLDILRDLRAISTTTPVLVLSMHAEEQFAVRALRAGASGYLTKASVTPELIKAVEQVLGGRPYVSSSLAQHLATGLISGTGEPASTESLSAREFEVLRLIASGKSGKEIADALSLSFKTVSTYRTRLLEKLQVRSNAELARYAAREGLVP